MHDADLRFCSRCGASLARLARFCGECGAARRSHVRQVQDQSALRGERHSRSVAVIAGVFAGVLGSAVVGGSIAVLDWPVLGGAATFALQVLLGFGASVALQHGALRASLAGPPAGMWLAWSPLVGLGCFGVAVGFVWAVTESASDEPQLAAAGPVWWEFLAAVLLAPAIEEWVSRGVLWTAVRRLTGPRETIVVTAALFALMHGLGGAFVLELPHRFIAGLAFGWLRARSGSLVPGWIAHTVLNLLVMTVH